jgi:hypothetical protein
VFDEPLDSRYGPSGCCILSKEFYETDTARGFVRGYNLQITRGAGPVNLARQGLARGQIPWGPGHHEAFARRYGQVVNIGICIEDLPEEHNTVTLDPEVTDSSGIPAPRIRYTMSANSRRMLEHAFARGSEVGRPAAPTSTPRARSATPAGTCSGPRAWAPIPSARWSTPGAAAMT